MALLASFATFSCSDKEASFEPESDRLAQPVFRTQYTVMAGSNDPYLCKLEGLNTAHLYWTRVEGAIGYEIMYCPEQSVATGKLESWLDPKINKNNLKDTIIYGQQSDELILKHLMYSRDYRFAIRALSDLGEAHHSKWFGIGDDLHHYDEGCKISMGQRYNTPTIVTGDDGFNIQKQSFEIRLDRSYDHTTIYQGVDLTPVQLPYTPEQLEEYNQHFGTSVVNGQKVWNISYLIISPGEDNPDAKIPDEFRKIKLTDDMFDADQRATIYVNGVDSNTVYTVWAIDQTIADTLSSVDAMYNMNVTVRTKGTPGKPIVVEEAKQDTIHYFVDGAEQVQNLPIPAIPLQAKLEDFMKNSKYAENQAYYLKGGETYFLTSGLQVYKGFKLATDPADIAAGKPRAKVLLYHSDILRGQGNSPAFFMLGRMPIGSESPLIVIKPDQFIVNDIDFSIPMTGNAGDGYLTNSYFMNMYNNGMGTILDKLELKNCSFQGIVGGFYRVQALYGVTIKEFTIDNCDFYNGGYYSTSGRRYNYFHANPEANPNINIWQKFTMKNCTLYDNPLGYMFNHNKQQSIDWPASVHYDITLENNTIVNFNTTSTSNYMFNLRWIPGGSKFTLRNNLFVQTRQEGDEYRQMNLVGCDIRTVNGSGIVDLDFENNYATSDNYNASGEIFNPAASAFSYNKKNCFGSLENDYDINWGPAGSKGLKIIDAGITAKDLMVQPNPRIHAAEANHYDHQCDGIDGTVTNIDAKIRPGYQGHMVNLKFKNFNNVLVEKGIGAPKWRQ